MSVNHEPFSLSTLSLVDSATVEMHCINSEDSMRTKHFYFIFFVCGITTVEYRAKIWPVNAKTFSLQICNVPRQVWGYKKVLHTKQNDTKTCLCMVFI